MATQRKEKSPPTDRPVLEIRAKGPGVRPGRVPVPDLIKICEDAQRAVNRQAEAMEGRQTGHRGPVPASLRRECTLELIGIKAGSTRLQFTLAKPERPLFPEQATLAGDVVSELAITIKHLGNGDSPREIDEGVLQTLYDLGSITETTRISEIEWIAPRTSTHRRVWGSINATVRERVASRLSSPRKVVRQVDGVLDMADFRPRDRKCRIDPAIGSSVMCTFDEKDSAKIQSLMRRPVRVRGEATLQPYSDRVDVLRIDSIEPLSSLALGEGDFFANYSLAELVGMQGVKPVEDVSILAGGFPEDVDVDAFLKDIQSGRG
jgi:hypothetical protein